MSLSLGRLATSLVERPPQLTASTPELLCSFQMDRVTFGTSINHLETELLANNVRRLNREH